MQVLECEWDFMEKVVEAMSHLIRSEKIVAIRTLNQNP